MISIVVILGALCSVVKPVNAICAYDNVKAYYFDLEKDAIDSCHKDKSGKVCAAYARSKGIPAPVHVAVPESYNEVQRKKAICINNEKLHLWYKTKADIIRKSLDAEYFKVTAESKAVPVKSAQSKAVPVKSAQSKAVPVKSAQSNPDLLEIKLRDYVIGKIQDEIKKHLDDLPLNESDILVLSLQVCKKDLKPVTRSIVKFLFEKSDNRLDKLCGILAGR